MNDRYRFVVLAYLMLTLVHGTGCDSTQHEFQTTKQSVSNLSYSKSLGWLRSSLTRGHHDHGIDLCYSSFKAHLVDGGTTLQILDNHGFSDTNSEIYTYVTTILQTQGSRAVYSADSSQTKMFVAVPYPDDHVNLFGSPPWDEDGFSQFAWFDLRGDGETNCCSYESGRLDDAEFPQCSCDFYTICGKNPSCPPVGCGYCRTSDPKASMEICSHLGDLTIFESGDRIDEVVLPSQL